MTNDQDMITIILITSIAVGEEKDIRFSSLFCQIMVNPSNAMITFAKSTRTQLFLKTI